MNNTIKFGITMTFLFAGIALTIMAVAAPILFVISIPLVIIGTFGMKYL